MGFIIMTAADLEEAKRLVNKYPIAIEGEARVLGELPIVRESLMKLESCQGNPPGGVPCARAGRGETSSAAVAAMNSRRFIRSSSQFEDDGA